VDGLSHQSSPGSTGTRPLSPAAGRVRRGAGSGGRADSPPAIEQINHRPDRNPAQQRHDQQRHPETDEEKCGFEGEGTPRLGSEKGGMVILAY